MPLMPITSSASISSEIRIEPSSATIPVPTFAAIMYPNAVGHELAQVAPRREHARVRGRAVGAVEVGALDAALQADDEHQAPDHERRGDDQDPGLAQRLAEEPEHPQAKHFADDPRGELDDLAERLDPAARGGEQAFHRLT